MNEIDSFFCMYMVGRGLVNLENQVIIVVLENLAVLGNLANLGIVPQIT